MCATCGCSDEAGPAIIDVQSGKRLALTADHDHHHHHDHSHAHAHHAHSHGAEPGHSHGTTLHLQQEVLAKNNRLAERNRGWFAGRNILALNLVSSPGSGKTTLLERTLRDLGAEVPFQVIEGDQATTHDAE